MNVKTDIDLTDLAIVDRDRQERLLGWKTFHVGALNVASPPMSVVIGDVGLTNLQARTGALARRPVEPRGRVRQTRRAGRGEAVRAALQVERRPAHDHRGARGRGAAGDRPRRPQPDAPMPLTIGQVNLQGGQVTFTDQSVRPSYTAEVSDLRGSNLRVVVDGRQHRRHRHPRGAINRSGALTIAGQGESAREGLSLDLRAQVRDMELRPPAPTREIRGLRHRARASSISPSPTILRTASSTPPTRLVLDQFTFGGQVDSPEAVKLPVCLAVALLMVARRYRRGLCRRGLAGRSRVRASGAPSWVLRNLVEKAVTAPFALLASAFGGGEELSHLDFPRPRRARRRRAEAPRDTR